MFGNVSDILVQRLGHGCDIFDLNYVLNHARTEKLHNICFENAFQVLSNKQITENPAYVVQ